MPRSTHQTAAEFPKNAAPKTVSLTTASSGRAPFPRSSRTDILATYRTTRRRPASRLTTKSRGARSGRQAHHIAARNAGVVTALTTHSTPMMSRLAADQGERNGLPSTAKPIANKPM